MFNMPVKEGNSSNFAGAGMEVVKGGSAGTHGHIAIKTNSIPRAIAFMERACVAVDMNTAKGPDGGPIQAVYLRDEVGGFAVHLLQAK
jgi:2-dehydro-3-deoxyphosphogluconate aldolase/(4S)-4-hydroxy-2-oxoglutarate aldolase